MGVEFDFLCRLGLGLRLSLLRLCLGAIVQWWVAGEQGGGRSGLVVGRCVGMRLVVSGCAGLGWWLVGMSV